jgi:hypothetical protein
MINECVARNWLLAAVVSCSTHSLCLAVTWDGPADDDPCCVGDGITWGDRFNWDTDAVPGPADVADVGDHHVMVLTMSLHMVLDVELAEDGQIDVLGTLNASGRVENNGTIFIDNGPPGPAGFSFGVGGLEGSGEVVLGDSNFATSGAALFGPGVGTGTHAAGHTVRGEGSIAGNWINAGLIRAEDVSGDMIGMLRMSMVPSFVNNGTIRTSSTGDILLSGTNITMGGAGRLIADDNTITLILSTITGGTLESINDGQYLVPVNSGLNVLTDVTLEGELDLREISQVRIAGGGMVNNGTITLNVNNTSGPSTLSFLGNPVLSGSGVVLMNRQSDFTGARFETPDETSTVTQEAGHTIRGEGWIRARLVNNSIIEAEDTNGDGTGVVMISNPTAGSGNATNNHIIRANSGGTIRLSGRLNQSSTGQLIAMDGGTVDLSGGTLIGGTLSTQGSGAATVSIDSILSDVTNDGILHIPGGGSQAVIRLQGSSFTNKGTVTVNNTVTGLAGRILVENDIDLEGNGTIILNAAGTGSQFDLVSAGRIVTQHAGHTIRGIGQINGVNSLLINNGTLEGLSGTQLLEINSRIGGSGLLRNVRIDGTHAPGESTAIVPLEGAYTINNFGGRLELEIGGTTPGTGYDQLFSSDPSNVINIGTVQGTTLKVSIINHFVPAVGDMFTIISTAGTITGEFLTEILPLAAGNNALTWEVHYNPTNVTLEVVSTSGLAGDFNFDGTVDAADYVVWRKNGLSEGEYEAWVANFGASGGGSVSASTHDERGVPEPGSLRLVILVAVVVSSHRRRFRLEPHQSFWA